MYALGALTVLNVLIPVIVLAEAGGWRCGACGEFNPDSAWLCHRCGAAR